VTTPSGFLKSIQSLPAGDESVILLVRGGEELELTARLGARPVGN